MQFILEGMERQADFPDSSLTRNNTNGGVMRCQSCRSNEITVIGFSSGDGTTYQFCRYCETGTWEASGEKVATTHMLAVASTIEPGRRRAAAA